MDKVLRALENSLGQTSEPELRAQLTAAIERLRRRDRARRGDARRRPPAGGAAPRGQASRRSR